MVILHVNLWKTGELELPSVIIIGGGLAGCEAAWHAAELGVDVVLYEMRPEKMTPAHQSGRLGELVCSNSLKSEGMTGHGLLKEEMKRLGSLIVDCAQATRVPAGQALAVDRERFGDLVTSRIESHPRITLCREEVTAIPTDRPVIIASGPLTSDALAEDIARVTGTGHLHFFDAIAPSVEADSIDRAKCFDASRYGKGEGYINCPFDLKDDYFAFREELINAEKAPLEEFERDPRFFEGCLPVEELAARGPKTLAFGPMKPVGLVDPATGRRPYANVQLRQENEEGTIYGLVGFQTRLKWPEQKRVFSMIPGLENAKFVRYGQMHRNTFIDSPRLLHETLRLRSEPDILFAGQIIGVEGYMESAASGIIAGTNAARLLLGQELITMPHETMIGALLHYVATCDLKRFQPMNSNYGILPPLPEKIRDDKVRKERMYERAIQAMSNE
jgi:methylenetetrahydrofolate--tRNA-(uracil-5-)-methyltransferase